MIRVKGMSQGQGRKEGRKTFLWSQLMQKGGEHIRGPSPGIPLISEFELSLTSRSGNDGDK